MVDLTLTNSVGIGVVMTNVQALEELCKKAGGVGRDIRDEITILRQEKYAFDQTVESYPRLTLASIIFNRIPARKLSKEYYSKLVSILDAFTDNKFSAKMLVRS